MTGNRSAVRICHAAGFAALRKTDQPSPAWEHRISLTDNIGAVLAALSVDEAAWQFICHDLNPRPIANAWVKPRHFLRPRQSPHLAPCDAPAYRASIMPDPGDGT